MGATLILKMIGKFLVDNWKPIVLGLLVLGLYLYWDHRTNLIADQAKQIATLTTQVATETANCTKDKQTLLNQLEQQNAAIQAFQDQSKANQQKVDQAKTEVIQIQKYYSDEMKKILTGVKPGDCNSAIKYLVDAAGQFEVKKRPTTPVTGATK